MSDAAGLPPRLTAHLAELAALGQTQTYGAMARALDCRMGLLTALLEEMMEADTVAHHPLRAALLNARGTTLPAPGFFAKAAELGHVIPDPAAFTLYHRTALEDQARPLCISAEPPCAPDSSPVGHFVSKFHIPHKTGKLG